MVLGQQEELAVHKKGEWHWGFSFEYGGALTISGCCKFMFLMFNNSKQYSTLSCIILIFAHLFAIYSPPIHLFYVGKPCKYMKHLPEKILVLLPIPLLFTEIFEER